MNWQRGILLAGINLLAAAPLILMLEARDAQSLQDRKDSTALAARAATTRAEPAKKMPASSDNEQQEETVFFDPCAMWVHYTAPVRVERFSNLPAFALTGWRIVCPAKWTLAGMLQGKVGLELTDAGLAAQRRVDMGLGLLVVVQWFLIGAFSLSQSQKWWREPGKAITACTIAAACLALIPATEELALIPGLLAAFGWFWWFGLLAWRTVQFGWRRMARPLAH
jgi:hypothetical protein